VTQANISRMLIPAFVQEDSSITDVKDTFRQGVFRFSATYLMPAVADVQPLLDKC
jgi:hypothetical protein